MRAMFDSVTPARLPANATMVACYRDGSFANEAEVRRRFPHATIVTITVNGSHDCEVGDCENGDMTPQSAAAWAKKEIARGNKPTIYCNESTWPDVKAEVARLGITVSYWIAHYDGICDIPAGAVAKQYQERKDQNLDYSAVASHWPGVDPEVTASTASKPVPLPDTKPGTHPFPLPAGHVFHGPPNPVRHVALDTVYRYFNMPVPADHAFTSELAAKIGHFQATHRLNVPTPGVLDATTWKAMT
jgi:hypothetical protein